MGMVCYNFFKLTCWSIIIKMSTILSFNFVLIILREHRIVYKKIIVLFFFNWTRKGAGKKIGNLAPQPCPCVHVKGNYDITILKILPMVHENNDITTSMKCDEIDEAIGSHFSISNRPRHVVLKDPVAHFNLSRAGPQCHESPVLWAPS